MFQKLDALLFTTKFRAKEAMQDFITNEEGDTNIISVIIILVIVIGLAITFSSEITNLSTGIWNRIKSDAGSFT